MGSLPSRTMGTSLTVFADEHDPRDGDIRPTQDRILTIVKHDDRLELWRQRC